jgi:predicted lipoprotein with Yx(FWY)xxD motif
MRRLTALLPFFAVALIAVGCGNEDANSSDTASGSDAAMKTTDDAMSKGDGAMNKGEDAMKGDGSMAEGSRIKVVSSDYGRVIADDRGEALYLFDKEDAGRAECYGPCAKAWPPVLTKGKPQGSGGVKQGLLGTTRRNNGGLQVTYAGQPLYYYVKDSPGKILCQDVEEFGGTWLVVKPSGRAAS